MKNKLSLFMTLFIFSLSFSQVGINTINPNSNALLHVSEKVKKTDSESEDILKGIMIPRLTESERDKLTYEDPLANPKVIRLSSTDNSLMIYNTTENCYNYWNYLEKEWKSLCGKFNKATFTFNCSEIIVKGTYIEGKELSNSNYLTIPVTVTKPGEYTLNATSENGYSFTASGTFLKAGSYTVQVAGQGTPIKVQKDTLSISANGLEVSCTPSVAVDVLSSSGSYTISCGSAIVNGVYKVSSKLTTSNTITLPIDVTNLGSYTITSNTVNGISFSGSGTFKSLGSQNITLFGTGKPLSTAKTTLTLTTDSTGEVSTSCSVTVIISIPKKSVLHIGSLYAAGSGASRRLMDSSVNFGTNASSIVKAEGFTHSTLTSFTSSTLRAEIAKNPDIVIIGYSAHFDVESADIITQYLNNKGIVIAFQDGVSSEFQYSGFFLRSVFSNPSLTPKKAGGAGGKGAGGSNDYAGAGTVYQLANDNNTILNGPFGDARGKYWGEDRTTTTSITGITGVTPLSYSQGANDEIVREDGYTGFLHNSLNLVWFGDGGFIATPANGESPSNTSYPFEAPSSGGYKPIAKTYGYAGNGFSSGSIYVYNSIVFANALAWALDKAEHNGINTK